MNKRGVYVVTSLGGELMSEGERREVLAEAAHNKVFRALVQIVEEEKMEMESKMTDPESLKDGTQAHWAGAVDGLNGALLRIAETVAGLNQQQKQPRRSTHLR